MRDASGELTERGELLRLHEAVLCGAQILQRLGQFACAGLNTFEQAHILDCDRRLVGESRDKLDLLVGERPRLLIASISKTPIGTPSRSSGTPRTVRNPPIFCALDQRVFRIGQERQGYERFLPSNSARPTTDPRPARSDDLPCNPSNSASEAVDRGPNESRPPSGRDRWTHLSASHRRAADSISASSTVCKIEGRAADDLEHVGGRGLLLQRFAQLA